MPDEGCTRATHIPEQPCTRAMYHRATHVPEQHLYQATCIRPPVSAPAPLSPPYLRNSPLCRPCTSPKSPRPACFPQTVAKRQRSAGRDDDPIIGDPQTYSRNRLLPQAGLNSLPPTRSPHPRSPSPKEVRKYAIDFSNTCSSQSIPINIPILAELGRHSEHRPLRASENFEFQVPQSPKSLKKSRAVQEASSGKTADVMPRLVGSPSPPPGKSYP